MRECILAILKTHGVPETNCHVEIISKGTSFSRPLVIRIKEDIQIAHYIIGEWDVEYDPIVQFDLNWKPLSIYRYHTGYKKIESDELNAFLQEWSKLLLESGYNDLQEAQCKHKL